MLRRLTFRSRVTSAKWQSGPTPLNSIRPPPLVNGLTVLIQRK